MDIEYHITSEFPAVFTVNGVFFEDACCIEYDSKGVLYVTVFPLEPQYNPYTVKLADGRAYSCDQLVTAYRLPDRRVVVRLKPRYNYVYAPKISPEPPATLAARFFRCVKNGNLRAARTLMTAELSATVNDRDLGGFFDGFRDLVEDGDSVYLIDDDGNGHAYRITVRSGLIDNIEEIE